MEEVQSWWEVPAIAHFCSVFRAAFNLIYFDVGELEAALLNMQDPEMSISLEQLFIKLLEGCLDELVSQINWEEKLKEIMDDYSKEDYFENPLENSSFHALTTHAKVGLLLKLCQIRLDIAVAEDAIKDIPSQDMQAKCIGQDGESNSYWYFEDERLYKEKKETSAPKKKGKETRRKENPWSIVCHNLSDWENLARKFSKSSKLAEKKMAKDIQEDYLQHISQIIDTKERLLRKRYLELAPKRTSSRISKVQAMKQLEKQKADEIEEKKRQEHERQLALKEQKEKKQKVEDRRKRAEERERIIEERAMRARQRMHQYEDDSDDSSESDYSNSSSNMSQKNPICDSKEKTANSVFLNLVNNKNAESINTNKQYVIQQKVFNVYDLADWKAAPEPNHHILHPSSSETSNNKRFRIDDAGRPAKLKVFSSNSFSTHKENEALTPFQLNTYNVDFHQRQYNGR